MNICADAPQCGAGNAGCELENGHPVNPVGVEKTLEYSTDGLMKLTYKGALNMPTGDVEAQRPQSGSKSTSRLQRQELIGSLTHNSFLLSFTGTRDTFTINFVCDQNSQSGSLKLVREDMSTKNDHVVHDAFFEFSTALACMPAPVDCQIIGTVTLTRSDFLNERDFDFVSHMSDRNFLPRILQTLTATSTT